MGPLVGITRYIRHRPHLVAEVFSKASFSVRSIPSLFSAPSLRQARRRLLQIRSPQSPHVLLDTPVFSPSSLTRRPGLESPEPLPAPSSPPPLFEPLVSLARRLSFPCSLSLLFIPSFP